MRERLLQLPAKKIDGSNVPKSYLSVANKMAKLSAVSAAGPSLDKHSILA